MVRGSVATGHLDRGRRSLGQGARQVVWDDGDAWVRKCDNPNE